MFKLEFCKALSANDLGLTESHQAGLLIPKRIARLPYFPILDRFSENPREYMTFYSIDLKTSIQLSYIYYNNKDRVMERVPSIGSLAQQNFLGSSRLYQPKISSLAILIIQFEPLSLRMRIKLKSTHPAKQSVPI